MDQHGESCCAVSHSLLVTRSEPQETEQMLETHECVLISFSHCLDANGQENKPIGSHEKSCKNRGLM